MVVVFGVSKGLGFSIVNQYLLLNYKVIGVGRRNSIINNNFSFLEKDLSLPQEFDDLTALLKNTTEDIKVIYNAGDLGEVATIEQLNSNPSSLFQLNVFTWMKIVQTLLNLPSKNKITFLSISSGAGRRGIPGWAYYGSSKAAMDNFMMTLKEECLLNNLPHIVYSLAPGVMDTGMQSQIRSLSSEQFPHLDTYRELSDNMELLSTQVVALKIYKLLASKYQDNVLLRIQDL